MKKIFFFFIASSFILCSCVKIIERQSPQNSISADDLANDPASIRAALNGAYSSLLSGNYMGLRYWALSELYADNLNWTGTFPSFGQFFNKNLLADNVEISNMWLQIYTSINRCNTTIEAAIKNTSGFTGKNPLIAEARALRAYNYFNLLRLWGGNENGYNKGNDPSGRTWGVPIRTKPTLKLEDAAPIARSTEAEVWNQILSDLDPVEVIANLETVGNLRITQSAALALRARVQLYRENWAEAESLATSVIGTTTSLSVNINFATGGLYTNLYGATAPSGEVLWSLPFDPTNQNAIAFFYLPASLGGRNEIGATIGLRDAHEPNDGRRIINFTQPPYPPGFPNAPNVSQKTLKYTRVSTGDDYFHHIRLAEVFLIRAEARARIGTNLAGAAADLNVVRTRAGLPNTTAATQSDLLDAILQERRVELAHEGHRLFDLRRYGRLDLLGMTTNSFRVRLPIPLTEILRSGPIMVQNPGY